MAKNQEKNVDKKQPVPAAPTITYTVDEINKVMQYLGTRPYQEVAGLIQVMQSGKSS